MKFFATLLFAAVGVSAAGSATAPSSPGSTCLADYILEDCLGSTTKTANSCDPTDYVCLCAAYQAVLTCYNNCPNDIRGPSVQQQVDSYCRTASLLHPKTTATKAKASQSHASSSSEETETAASSPSSNDEASATDSGPSQTTASRTSATTAAAASSSTNAAATMVGSLAGIVVAVAGAAVAMV